MKRIFLNVSKLLLVTSFVMGAAVCDAQTNTNTNANKAAHGHAGMNVAAMSDTGFVRKNIMDNMMEIRLSEIGRDNATSDSVRRLAEQMITDHTQILSDLTTIGGRLDVPAVDTTTMNMPVGDNTAREVFDRTWVTQMLAMHQAKVAELQAAGPQLKDPALKAAAMSALPKIKLHADMLQRLSATVSAGK